uniref:Uncharacterized protein n=1 Tax=uncultured marine virus TaxID=186617 RepID=A0A0F7LA87_9VIRU|nr:hypothetical protein [uncultured marine virus]
MEITKEEAQFILGLLNRVTVQGDEADGLVFIKQKIKNGIKTDTTGDSITEPAAGKDGGTKGGTK